MRIIPSKKFVAAVNGDGRLPGRQESLDERASRMNQFWKALIRLQYQDVAVVAVCATREP